MAHPQQRLPISCFQHALFLYLSDQLGGTPVFKVGRPNEVYPYVTFGDYSWRNEPTKLGQVVVLSTSLNVWSKGESVEEVEALASQIVNCLAQFSPDLSKDKWKVFQLAVLGGETVQSYTTSEFYQRAILRFEWRIQNTE